MNLVSRLFRQVPSQVRSRGESIFRFRGVTITSGDAHTVTATVAGSLLYEVNLELIEDVIGATCTCPYFDSEGLCKHIWATVLAADRTNYLRAADGVSALGLAPVDEFDDDEFEIDPFPLNFSRPPAPAPRPPQWKVLLAQGGVAERNGPPVEPWRPGREIHYAIDIASTMSGSGLYLEVGVRDRKQNGELGVPKPTALSRADIAQIPSALDREIMAVLGGVETYYQYSDSRASSCRMSGALMHLLLPKLCASGHLRLRHDSRQSLASQILLAWDEGPPWTFRVALTPEGSEWRIGGTFERGDERMGVDEPALLVKDGFLFARSLVSRFDAKGAFRWIHLLRNQSKIGVPMADGEEFLGWMLTQPELPEIDWPENLRYEEIAPEPQARFKIAESLQHLSAHNSEYNKALRGFLTFDYGGVNFLPEDASPGRYDPEQRRFLKRDKSVEEAAGAQLAAMGLKVQRPMYAGDTHPYYNVPARRLPQIVRDLLKAGWHVEAEGKAFRRASSFSAEVTSGIDWFELHAAADYGTGVVQLPDLLKALKQGTNLVQLGDGSYGVLPEELLKQYGMLIGMGKAHGDHIRYSRAQTGLLDALLASREDVKVDAVFAAAREHLRRFEGIQPAAQPAGFTGELRTYQREGVAWMGFLQALGFGGCVADDMGVGKTAQVLALLETRRELRESGNSAGPSLVVVPRSIVYNWKQEAERFTPRLRVLDHSGTGRDKSVDQFENYDLILTTYGTLRRDAVDFQNFRFDYIILDEAQAIKNAGTESAKAARLLQGNHRLVMSGTPIENHLGELWSLFEFLNPGMLGSLSGGMSMKNPDEPTRVILSKALRPFILRRTKDQVAKELPQKLEQTVYCELDKGQRRSYDELRDHYRQALLGRIETQGMGKSKMQILEALLRLRQAACHPGLLDPKRKGELGAKLEVLMARLTEVIAEGHKALVFSQFTSLLAIVRMHLDQQSVVYEYLDGQVRDRQARVERFQSDPACPLFLISLKAGGVGLNLTAAEYVFLLDPWWNPAVEAQAIDRAHRIGQSKRVFAYRLIAKDTVEEKVLELQNSKRNLADAIIRADASLVRDLKREDLEFLFS